MPGWLVEVEHLVARDLRRLRGEECFLDIAGQFEVAVELGLEEALVVRQGLFHRLRRGSGDPGENLEIPLAKLPPPPRLRVELHDPENAAVCAADRHAHHRPEPPRHDALAGIEPGIGLEIIGEDRAAGLQDGVEDRHAQPRWPLLPWPTGLLPAKEEPPGIGIDQEHEAPVGLRVDLEEALEQPGENLLERQ